MFTQHFNKYVCEGDSISCDVDGFTVTARIYRDNSPDTPEQRDDGFWPSHDPKAAGYVPTEKFEEQQAFAERVLAAWKNDEWFYCGVSLVVTKEAVELVPPFRVALWGVECNYPDSDNSYLQQVANELLDEALDMARAVLAKLCGGEC